MLPTPEVDAYLGEAISRTAALLGKKLRGVYALGSLALGGFQLGRSDIDMAAVVNEPPTLTVKEELVESLSHPQLPCPTRGLEFVLYNETAVTRPVRQAGFEVNLNTGPSMAFACSFDPTAETAYWFVLDRSIARARGIPLYGPPPAELFAEIPHHWIVQALLDMLGWHRAHEPGGPNIVLNAARSWRYLEERTWSSKVEGARWARERLVDPKVVDQALAIREDPSATPPPYREVDRLVDLVVQAGSSALREPNS